MKRGIITLAVGEHYCKLAANLYRSYKVFSRCEYPFYVITNSDGQKKLEKIFDGVLVIKEYQGNFLDKIQIYNYTPFDETLFIDADSNVVRDIEYLFDEYIKNGSDISGISGRKNIENQDTGHLFGRKFKETFNIMYDFPNFNGGVYYFRKSIVANQCIDFIQNELLPKYSFYELNFCNNGTTMHDEPLMIAGMLRYNMKTLDIDKDIMRLVHNPQNVKWDMKNRVAKYQWYELTVSPDIIHWKTDGTLTLKYAHYNAIVYVKYYNVKKVFQPFVIATLDCSFLYLYKIKPWLQAHFSVDYFKFTMNRIGNLFQR